jgi:hypothetical protein
MGPAEREQASNRAAAGPHRHLPPSKQASDRTIDDAPSVLYSSLNQPIIALQKEGTMQAQWVRWVVFAAVAIVVMVAVSSAMVFALGARPTRIDSYRLVDDRTLVVTVIGGKNAWGRTEVREELRAVTVTALVYDDRGLPQSAAGYPLELKVTLTQPLGDRVILDGSNGEEVARSG